VRDVYLDNAATSWPKPPAVLQAITDFFQHAGGNTGRSGHRRSIASSRAVSLARERLADLLGAETPDDLVFTKNATEALNLAILGLAAGVGSRNHGLAGARVLQAQVQTNPSIGRSRGQIGTEHDVIGDHRGSQSGGDILDKVPPSLFSETLEAAVADPSRDLAKIGVTAEIKSFEWGEYRKRMQAGEHQMGMLGWTGDNGDPDNFLCYFFCPDKPSREGFHSNPPLSDVLKRASTLTSQTDRAKLYRQAERVEVLGLQDDVREQRAARARRVLVDQEQRRSDFSACQAGHRRRGAFPRPVLGRRQSLPIVHQ
jgi:hypothetical protein